MQRITATTLKVPQGTPPKDRSILGSPKLGAFHEHDLVRLTAYVFEAETADYKTTGESVNCGWGLGEEAKNKAPSKEAALVHNDIHVALVAAIGQSECTSVTAEISPHIRPANWNDTSVSSLKGKQVRVTGQLMYDGSHQVFCPTGNKPDAGDPIRQSLWEIHPVYKVEVCQSVVEGNCAESEWKPL